MPNAKQTKKLKPSSFYVTRSGVEPQPPAPQLEALTTRLGVVVDWRGCNAPQHSSDVGSSGNDSCLAIAWLGNMAYSTKAIHIINVIMSIYEMYMYIQSYSLVGK